MRVSLNTLIPSPLPAPSSNAPKGKGREGDLLIPGIMGFMNPAPNRILGAAIIMPVHPSRAAAQSDR